MAFSEIRTQRRITVREASGGDLFKGAVAIAAGTTLISCLTLDISTGLKGALLVGGCLLCLYGAKWVRKYLKDDKTYREYAPEWDDKHFIYDRFAKGLNAWYRQEELPEDADGDIAYFLKLQRERLRNKGLQMEKRVVPTKGTGYGTGKRSRKSLWYTTDMFFEQVSGTLAFHNANETVFEQQLEMTMYEIVAHTPDTTRATSCEFLLYKDEIHCQLQADLYADHDPVYGERIHHYFISQYIYQFPGAAVHAVQQLYDGTAGWWYDRLSGGRCKTSGCSF